MKYEAVFDCGDEEMLAHWAVVEWTFDDGRGNRAGRTIDKFFGSEAECQAHEVADLLNQAENINFDAGCEFDKEIV